MKEIKLILAGIGFIIFGIVFIMGVEYVNGLLVPGMIFPLLGIIMVIAGLSIKDNTNV